jgi:hypothetical protein
LETQTIIKAEPNRHPNPKMCSEGKVQKNDIMEDSASGSANACIPYVF